MTPPSLATLLARLRGFTDAALIARVPEADPAAAVLAAPVDGEVPTHLTIAYPFAIAATAAPATARLAEVFAARRTFSLELHALRRFDDVAYLAPREFEGCADLARAVQDQFPGNPLYGGAFATYIPHVSIGPVDRLTPVSQTEAERLLPIHAQVREVELWALRRRRWVCIRSFALAP